MSIKKYTHGEIHKLLCERLKVKSVEPEDQAECCPYYVPLKGALGCDWGVIVNPASPKFGKVVFEHDGCGCNDHPQMVGTQTGRDWILPSGRSGLEK
jgi:hypothetical protein